MPVPYEREGAPVPPQSQRAYRYYDVVMVAFVVVLVCSNLIGPAKIAQVELPLVGAIVFGAGVLFFPISYVFGDVLTEVYGYARARKVIWSGFAALAFASLMAAIVVHLPPALATILVFTSPQHMKLLITDPLGIKMVVVAATMQAIGTLIIRKLVNVPY